MREYHVDTCNLFQERMHDKTQFGGRRSVRYPDGKMLVVWGHDECNIKQYTLSKNRGLVQIVILPLYQKMKAVVS
jgi:hypothetical protein